MSAEMRDFAAAFNKGLDRGVGMYEKEQDRAIQREHNKLLRDQHAATERHQTRRDDLYAESVKNAGVLSAARAQAALNKGSGKGGGGAPAPSNANVDMVHQGALAVGLVPPPEPPAPAAPSVTNNFVQSDSPDPGPIAPPVMKKGGMVKKYADGGMSVAEALSYGPKGGGYEKPEPKGAANAATSSFDKAYEAARKNKPDGTIKNAAPKPTATGPVGSGPAGSYTTADVQPGGVLDTTSAGIGGTDYRRGGAVRRYAGGGSIELSDDMTGKAGQAAVAQMAVTPADKNPDGSTKTKDQDSGTIASTARAVASGGNFDFSGLANMGSADGATGSGGDSTGGVSGTGGVGGSASDSAGGSAAAGTSGDAGSDGGGTYRRGGRVRRFQSGGRVMEAIDTGTSGPGSGYGYRAAPPSRGY